MFFICSHFTNLKFNKKCSYELYWGNIVFTPNIVQKDISSTFFVDAKLPFVWNHIVEEKKPFKKGDFYLGFYTSELKESWKQENIEKAANMIKDMARCAVKVNVCYPFEVVVEIKQEE